MNTPHKHAALIHAWADGAIIQVNASRGWEDLSDPSWKECSEYRIKPEAPKEHKRYIDWSKMPRGTMTNIGEIAFHVHRGALVIQPDVTSYASYHNLRLIEQPNFQYWGGGECPVPDGILVKIIMRDGKRAICDAGEVRWNNHGVDGNLHGGDIVAYRIIGLAGGWSDHEEKTT